MAQHFIIREKGKKKRKENRAAQKIVCPFQTFATQKPKARLHGVLKNIYIAQIKLRPTPATTFLKFHSDMIRPYRASSLKMARIFR